MRLPRSSTDAAMLSALLFPVLTAAIGNLQCDHIVVNDVSFGLEELGGPKSVMHSVDNDIRKLNTTYTIDLCRDLQRSSKVPQKEQCPGHTRVCAIERLVKGEVDTIDRVWPIAGDLREQGGYDMNAKWELLSKSKAHADVGKEGLRLELNGGWTIDDGITRKQKAIVEFLCDKDRKGDENLYDPEDKYSDGKDKREEKEDDGKKDGNVEDDGPDSASLQFVSYDADVLRLKWRTKFACEKSKEELDAEKNQHWGFFTWFILIAFLSTAAYLIFGSWLNYNRYGARGWDLLPHGDTIRDVPYLLKDWMRRVTSTLQGGGSRGGYAAV